MKGWIRAAALADAVGVALDDGDEFAAELFGDPPELGDVRDERAVLLRPAAHARHLHRRLVVDIDPRAALALEAAAADAARLDARDLVVLGGRGALLLALLVRPGASARGGRALRPR